jgi:YHS domain-containing protein
MRRFTSAAFVLALLVGTAGAFAAKPINARCPVKTDQPAKDGLSSEYKGFEIGFCCNNCKGAWGKNPEAYVKNVPELKAAMAKAEKDKEKEKAMTGPCDCKKTVKGYYCEKDKRELGPDDVRGNLCKRCEMKATEIEYCLKLIPKPFDPKKKVQDAPGEDKARISYECEKCGAKSEIETLLKHKDDCKPSGFGGGVKKICAKSGKMPHATEAK